MMRSYMTDHRTPMAWRHRDGGHRGGHHRHSPSEDTSSSSDEREEVPMVRGRRPHSRSRCHGRDGQSQFSSAEPYMGQQHPFRNGGTLRSTRSVPALALATWDGEPCPIHGHGIPYYHPHQFAHHQPPTLRRHGSLFDMRLPYYPPPPHFYPQPLMEKKQFHGSMPYFAPMMRPQRPYVIPAEPLPVRDPYKVRQSPPVGYAGSGKTVEDPYGSDAVCCKGHLIVLWIILAVVTIGVILGIVLGVTIA